VALNWHIIPEESNLAFQRIGEEAKIIDGIINPTIEEILKAVIEVISQFVQLALNNKSGKYQRQPSLR
jgi:hypothetical protein